MPRRASARREGRNCVGKVSEQGSKGAGGTPAGGWRLDCLRILSARGTWVDYCNDSHAPLLFVSGSEDHIMPPSVHGFAALCPSLRSPQAPGVGPDDDWLQE